MLDAWLSGFESLLHVQELVFLTVGMGVGLIAGAVPGFGPTTALALLIPLTYGMQPITALALSAGVMGAAPMGGSIAAILLNAPGAAPNAATCLDGYPLAQQGKGRTGDRRRGKRKFDRRHHRHFLACCSCCRVAKQPGAPVRTARIFPALPFSAWWWWPAPRAARCLRGLVTGVFGLMVASVGYDQVTGSCPLHVRRGLSMGRHSSRARRSSASLPSPK